MGGQHGLLLRPPRFWGFGCSGAPPTARKLAFGGYDLDLAAAYGIDDPTFLEVRQPLAPPLLNVCSRPFCTGRLAGRWGFGGEGGGNPVAATSASMNAIPHFASRFLQPVK